MKDFLGTHTRVGDHIFYSTTGRYPESRYCRVTRFTDKSMFAEILKHNRPGESGVGEEVVVRNDFINVSPRLFEER